MAETSTLQRVDLSVLRKQRFLIDLGDDVERILELNTTDMGVVNRLSDGYNNLMELDSLVKQLSEDTTTISEDDSDDEAQTKLKAFSDKLKEIDSKMRNIIDTIFDTNVCEVCCPSGSMYDPIAGKLRYEHVIDTLMELYSTSLSEEMAKTKKRVKTHTAKYTKSK